MSCDGIHMIYDTKTKNISFLKMSKILRERGVKNNKFMLTLYDEKLTGVDPHDKNISAENKVRVYRESCKNIWYFIREVVRIPADGSTIPYAANLGNITLTYLRSLNKNIIIVLPRQSGKTLGQVIVDVWNLCLVTKNTNAIYMNKGKSDAIKNLKLFKDVKDLLPQWMLDEFISDPKKDIDNQESKLIYRKNNSLRVVAPGSDPDQADKQGRGLTVSCITLDEFAFMKYNDITYKAAIPAFSKASENAKKNSTPYGIVISTTPNNIDEGTPGAFCYDMIEQAAKWNVSLFDLTKEELDDFITSNSTNDYIFVQYSYKELGRDDTWLEKQKRQLANDMLTLKREVLLIWPHSNDASVFSEEQLSKVFNMIRKPKSSIIIFNKYPIVFYEQPDTSVNYILSCDVSGGLSNDNSVITIIHPEDFRIVGDFKNSKVDTDTFRRIIEELMTFYFRKATLVIEKTGIGAPLIDTLIKNPVIEPRMFREEKSRSGEKTLTDGHIVRRKTKTLVYGVDTVKQTRDQMMDLLFDIIQNEYDKVATDNFYKEIATLERKRNGRIEAATGKHDDSIMSYLIFRWAVFYGTCYRDRFHVSPVPSRANVSPKDADSDNVLKRMTGIMNVVSSAENAVLINEDVYNNLLELTQKAKSPYERNETADAFMRIANMNNWSSSYDDGGY